MIHKKIVILFFLMLLNTLLIARSITAVCNTQIANKITSKNTISVIFKDKNNTIWFSSGNALKHYINTESTDQFADRFYEVTNTNHSGKDAHRNLIALNFALGLQSISSQNVKLPKIKILLLQPLWRILAFGLVLLLLLTVAIALITSNIGQKRLTEKLSDYEQRHAIELERQRLSGEMHEHILTSLTRISHISESITKTEAMDGLIEISNTSNKLIDKVSELNWYTHPNNNSLDAFFSYLSQTLYQILHPSCITFSLLLPDNAGNITLSINQKRNMLLMIKEMVNNAIKYSNAQEIIVKAVMLDKGLQFFVSDNGIGFDINQPTKGTGIKNIQMQVNDINGRLTLESELNLGTYYTVFIPLKS